MVALLQQGQQSAAAARRVVEKAGLDSIKTRVLAVAELRNALLHPSAIARASGTAVEAVRDRIAQSIRRLRANTRATFIGNTVRAYPSSDPSATAREAAVEFDAQWTMDGGPELLVSGANVFVELNAWIAEEGYRLLSDIDVARVLKPAELEADIFEVLMGIDALAARPT